MLSKIYQQISNSLIIIHYCFKLGHLKIELWSIIQCRFTSWLYFCCSFCYCFNSIHHDWLLLYHLTIIYTHAVDTLMKWWKNACFNSSKQIDMTLDFIPRYILLWNNFFDLDRIQQIMNGLKSCQIRSLHVTI